MTNPTASLIRIEQYTFQTEQAYVHASDFCLDAGTITHLFGPSGSGKSLFSQCLIQMINKKHQSGNIWFQEQNLTRLSPQDILPLRGSKLALVPPNHLHYLNPLRTCLSQLHETIINPQLSPANKRLLSLEWLDFMEIPEKVYQSYPHTLSGGQRQRLLLAIGMINNPNVLILDEPTTSLDHRLRDKILEKIQKRLQQPDTTTLIISHDQRIATVCHRHAQLKDGILTASNNTLAHTPSVHALPRSLHTHTPHRQPDVLQAQRVCVQRTNRFGVLQTCLDLRALSLKKGDILGITGPSGSGKTTLAYALMQLCDYTGNITIMGHAMHTLSPKAIRPLRKHFQMVFQDPAACFPKQRNLFLCMQDVINAHSTPLEGNRMLKSLMETFDLSEKLLHIPTQFLSSGQLQRMSIIRCLLTQPDILLLDEATTHLDPQTSLKTISYLLRYQQHTSLSVICISHDTQLLHRICQRVVHIKDGTCMIPLSHAAHDQNACAEIQ